MGDATCQLADRFHLLALPQGRLGLPPLVNLPVHPRFQCRVEFSQRDVRGFHSGSGASKEFTLTTAAVGSVEHGDANELKLARVVFSFDRIHQNRQPLSVSAHNIEGDLVEENPACAKAALRRKCGRQHSGNPKRFRTRLAANVAVKNQHGRSSCRSAGVQDRGPERLDERALVVGLTHHDGCDVGSRQALVTRSKYHGNGGSQ